MQLCLCLKVPKLLLSVTTKYTTNTLSSTLVYCKEALAPYLFVIVLDWILRTALTDESLGFPLQSEVKLRNGRVTTPGLTVLDLDFADDIAILSDCPFKAQIILSAIEKVAKLVGLQINQKKTEFLLVGSWTHPVTISLESGRITQVNDFKYLGSYLLNSNNDFQCRKGQAWSAAVRLHKIWYSNTLSRETKLKVFKTCVEPILLYNATTWTMNKGLTKKLDGSYTKLLRYALNIKWSDKITNQELYGDMLPISAYLRERRLKFLGHCWRSSQSAKQYVSDVMFWTCLGPRKRGNRSNYIKILLHDLGLPSDSKNFNDSVKQAQDMMKNKAEWRKRTSISHKRKK